MERQDGEIHRRAGLAGGRERRIDGPAAADAVRARPALGTNIEMSSSAKAGGSSQNEMLFMRGNAMSGAPIISGTNQLPKPPIIAGMTMKKIMIRPWPVMNTLYMCLPASSAASPLDAVDHLTPGPWKIWMPGSCSSMRIATDSRPPMTPATDREDQVHRADVLVVGRIDVAPPAGRMVMAVRRG